MLREMKGFFSSLMNARVELQNLSKVQKKEIRKAPYKFLSDQIGCFIVQLDLQGKVDHTVCVDGLRRLVWDNEEEYPLS